MLGVRARSLTGLLPIVLKLVLLQNGVSAEPAAVHFRCDTDEAKPSSGIRLLNVQHSGLTPGQLIRPHRRANTGSWQFDGHSAIAFAVPGNSPGFSEEFTWEGFFLQPAANQLLPETGIADRLVSQFAFDKGNWTRLAIGLVADSAGAGRLSVELEGFDGRTFGLGRHTVAADRWHHFALVHEGTPSAARIRWYLDYTLTGELLLGGQANQNTLRPPGSAAFTIGARLRSGETVNRGFEGLIDEVRLSPRPLKVDEMLRCDSKVFERDVEGLDEIPGRRADYWADRHRWAGELARKWSTADRGPSIDSFFDANRRPLSDASFLRRVSLTVRGRIPLLDEVEEFLADDRPDRRSRLIDRMLASPEWGDSWVGYWQDVLAENPSVVFPTLNNSGAFRQWIYESFRDNRPFDRFATELLMMEGADLKQPTYDGPASFSLATGNDAPMAMRAHVAMKAFAAVDLKCARCHDSPIDEFHQADLFLLAAYLNGGPLQVPGTSVAAIAKASEPGLITTSLTPGQQIVPSGLTAHWLGDSNQQRQLRPVQSGPRAEFAALITSPQNSRFSDVIVNRMWKRFFGSALIEPVDAWTLEDGDNHVLLRSLSADFVASGYDLKALARRILNSETWQSQRLKRQRMSAEQLVDSLFVAVGKDFQCEVLGVHATDPGAAQLPRPRRAWQFAALPNERDRPALGMPVNQTIVDVMTAFGWSGARQQPRSSREKLTSARQPLLLFNGLMSQRIVRLSETSAITELCLEDLPLGRLVDRLFLTVPGRYPDDIERSRLVSFLRPGFDDRRTEKPPRPDEPLTTFQPDWRKHLQAEQTRLMLAAQERVALGEHPTDRLTTDFRERVEDVMWALINSPEFVVVP